MKTILLPLDGSPLAEQALPYAASLAQRSGARILLVRATQAHTLLDVDAAEAQLGVLSRAEHDLEVVAARLRAEHLEVGVHVYYDSPASSILDAARRHRAELIVMSTHGRSGLGRMVYGSVADDILRHAEIPVLLIPPTVDHAWSADRPLTVLVPLDGSPLAEDALASAKLLAELLGARLHLLRVIEPPAYPLYGDGYVYVPIDDTAERDAARAYLNEIAGRLAAGGAEVEAEVADGLPSAVVPRVAQEQQADVIAMATHGRGGLARLVLGSVATGTLQRTHVPLLLTRPPALIEAVPLTQPTAASSAKDAAVTLSLTPAELVLVRQAVESLLLRSRDESRVADPLRVVLGRLRVAEHSAPATPSEPVGTP